MKRPSSLVSNISKRRYVFELPIQQNCGMWNEELVIADVNNDTEPSDADDQVESDN